MAIAYVKDSGIKTSSNVATSSGSFSTLPSAGNAIFVLSGGWHLNPYTVDAVTDNQGNSYTEHVERVTGGGSGGVQIYSDFDIGTPSGTFTITVDPTAASGNYCVWVAAEFSGIADTSALDVTASNAAVTGYANVTASSSTTQANELILVVGGTSNNDTNVNITTPTTGYTSIASYQNGNAILGFNASYKIVSATETPSAAWTHDNVNQDGWAAVLATFKAAGGGPLTGPVGQSSETDTAQSVARIKLRVAGQSSEVDATQSLGKVKTRPVSQIAEVDTAQSVNKLKRSLVAQSSETCTSQSINKVKTRSVSQVSESESAQLIGRVKKRSTGQAFETDTAQTVTKAGAITVVVGQTVETCTSQGIVKRKLRAVSQLSESDTSQSIVRNKSRLTVQSSSTNSAQSVSKTKLKSISSSVELDSAIGVTPVKRMLVNQIIEADTAFTFTARKLRVLSQPQETDLAQSVTVGGLLQGYMRAVALCRPAIGASAYVRPAVSAVPGVSPHMGADVNIN